MLFVFPSRARWCAPFGDTCHDSASIYRYCVVSHTHVEFTGAVAVAVVCAADVTTTRMPLTYTGAVGRTMVPPTGAECT